MTVSPNSISPESSACCSVMILMNDVFPTPLAPTIPILSPLLKLYEKSSKITLASPNLSDAFLSFNTLFPRRLSRPSSPFRSRFGSTTLGLVDFSNV